jgi:hypothetical protein
MKSVTKIICHDVFKVLLLFKRYLQLYMIYLIEILITH